MRRFERMKDCKIAWFKLLIILILGQFLSTSEANAQVIEVGASAGLSYYMGDINPNKPFCSSKVGFGAVVRYYDNTRWVFRLAYSNLQLDCSDAKAKYREERGLSFKTNVQDIALIAEFNFFDYFTGSKRNKVSPYIFGGVSYISFDPKAEDGTSLCNILTDVDNEVGYSDGKSKYSKTSASIPFGVGVKMSLSEHVGMTLEWRMDYAFTDWLDDCHAYYPTYQPDEQNELPTYVHYSDPTGYTDPDGLGYNNKNYIQRGNPHNNDWYGYLNVSLSYKFILPRNKDCNVGADKKYYKYY